MKKLIIVCEEKLRNYGDFLAQLISRNDDSGDKVIGVKDGMVAAQVWSEKEYTSNSAQISSEQYLLFIGNSKLIKEKRTHMNVVFSQYGMNYGWLGKQAVLFVDKKVSIDEYDDFFEFVNNELKNGNQKTINRLIEEKSSDENRTNHKDFCNDEEINSTSVEEETDNVLHNTAENTIDIAEAIKTVGLMNSTAKKNQGAFKKVGAFGVDIFNKTAKGLEQLSKNKDIENQQYTCLVLLFYLNGLGSFLELNEDK